MDYTFKDMATIDMVETVTDDATVLIEEEGVIKRAPKSEVGGHVSGGETPDMIITVTGNSETKLTSDNYTITEGSVENVFTAFHEGRYPVIKVRFYNNENTAYSVIREEYDAYACTYGENLWFSFITLNPYYSTNLHVHKIYMNSDGTLESSDLMKATLTSV